MVFFWGLVQVSSVFDGCCFRLNFGDQKLMRFLQTCHSSPAVVSQPCLTRTAQSSCFITVDKIRFSKKCQATRCLFGQQLFAFSLLTNRFWFQKRSWCGPRFGHRFWYHFWAPHCFFAQKRDRKQVPEMGPPIRDLGGPALSPVDCSANNLCWCPCSCCKKKNLHLWSCDLGRCPCVWT